MTESAQQEILESWLRQHQTLLFKVVRAYTFTPADQDDLFQEIVIQVWRSIPGFQEQSSLSTWLYRVSLNTALAWTRQERKQRQVLEQAAPILQESPKSVDERLVWLYEEITRLNEIDRSLMLLLLDGFSYKEMSDILGISESNVGVKISRIKKHLIQQSKNYAPHGI